MVRKPPLCALPTLVLLLAVGCSAGSGGLSVGSQSAGGSPAGTGGESESGGAAGGATNSGGATFDVADAATSALSVHVEQNHITVKILALKCGGGCADVEAIAEGGFPPYAYRWEDGSTDPMRHVCATDTTSYEVTVTDVGSTSSEFGRPPETVDAPLAANVAACLPPVADGGAPDGGECDGISFPQTLRADIFGTPTYFANGAPLPPGNYRVTYQDGCMKYDATWLWTVNASFNDSFVLVGATTTTSLGTLPGTSAPFGFGVGGYSDFAACVAANRALAPLDFTFAGGKLGVWQNDFQPPDNISGPNGDSPEWTLTRLDACR